MADSNDISTALAMIQEMLNNLVNSLDQMNSTKESNARLEGILSALREMNSKSQNQSSNTSTSNPPKQESQQSTQQSTILNPIVQADPEIKNLDGDVKSLIEAVKANSSVLMDVEKEQPIKKKNLLDVADDAKKAGKAFKDATNYIKDVAIGKTAILGMDKLLGAINPTVDAYRKMIASGNDFNGSMVKMREVAAQSGLTLDHFTKAIANGSEGLKMLGPQQFAGLNHAITESIKNMGDLGMTPEERASYMSDFLEGLRTSGRLLSINANNVNVAFRSMMTNVDELSHTLGVSREQAMKMLNDTRNNPNIQNAVMMLGGPNSTRGHNAEFLSTMGNGTNDQFKKLIDDLTISAATGRTMNIESSNALSSMHISPEEMTNLMRRVINSRDDTERNRILETIAQKFNQAGNRQQNYTEAAIGSGPGGQYYANMPDILAGARRYGQMREGLRTANTQPMGTHYTDNVTAPAMHQQDVNEANEVKLQNIFTRVLQNQGDMIGKALEAYQKATSSLADVMEGVGEKLSDLLKASGLQKPAEGLLSAAGDHPWMTLGGIMGTVIGGKVLSAMMTLNRMRKVTGRTSAKGTGGLIDKLTSAVTGKGATTGAEAATTASRMGTLSRMGSIAATGAEAAGGLAMGSMLAGVGSVLHEGYQLATWGQKNKQIDQQQQLGNITKQDADRQKSNLTDKNVGEGLGLAIGGALGTIIAPGIGTGIGMAAGAFLGREAGRFYGNTTHPKITTPKIDSRPMPQQPKAPSPPVIIPPNKKDDSRPVPPVNNSQAQTTAINHQMTQQNTNPDKTLNDIYDQNNKGYDTITNRLDSLVRSMDNFSRAVKNSGNNVVP